MKCAVIYGSKSEKYHQFQEAAEETFDTVLTAPLEGVKTVFDEDGTRLMYKNTDLCDFDYVHFWLFGNDMLYAEHLPEILKDHGVYTYMEGDSYGIASNKFYMMKVLSEGGVPVPWSAYTLSTKETERAAAELGYPTVIKLISGYGGKGVMKADSESDLSPIIDTLTLFEQDICLQEFIENPGEDIRIMVIGDKTYSYKRVSESDEFRSNVSAGGSMEAYEPSEEMKEAALRAARLCGFDFCGVDIIEDESEEGGFYMGEINASPGPAGVEEVCGISLPESIMEYAKQRVLEKQSQQGGI